MTDYFKINIGQIDPNPKQPRKHFAGIEELAQSIREIGLLEAITVRPAGDRFQVVMGERRWRACKLAGLTEIDAQVKDVSDQEAFELALVENVLRQNLTPMEEAEAFEDLTRQGLTQAAIAKTIGKGQSYVAHKLRLLKLPDFLTSYLKQGLLTENHIRQVAKLKDIYPPGLMRSFSTELKGDNVKNKDAASFLLFQLRPEGRALFLEAEPVQTDACRMFSDYVSKHNASIPQWEVAAFWWASTATMIPLNVADLTTGINLWRERYEDAIGVWLFMYDREPGKKIPKVPRGKAESEEYWGFWDDLKQSGSLSLDHREFDTDAAVRWWGNILSRTTVGGSYCLPSRMQCKDVEPKG